MTDRQLLRPNPQRKSRHLSSQCRLDPDIRSIQGALRHRCINKQGNRVSLRLGLLHKWLHYIAGSLSEKLLVILGQRVKKRAVEGELGLRTAGLLESGVEERLQLCERLVEVALVHCEGMGWGL